MAAQELGSYAVLAGNRHTSDRSNVGRLAGIGEAEIAPAQLIDIPCGQSPGGGPDIASERLGAFTALEHIALQHLDQRLGIAGCQRPVIGSLPSIEGFADAL